MAPHPRPGFEHRILDAFTDGIRTKPETTFGNVKADAPEHFVPGFERGDFVRTILGRTTGGGRPADPAADMYVWNMESGAGGDRIHCHHAPRGGRAGPPSAAHGSQRDPTGP
ncbi:hypothetical protein GCM10010358_11490 [Streptomyces minutiscleroticus]|uniref:Uncharacterized protein n=1 Tax=Streptomyces minutiscleroticus TaxID=68238 RepID=A0A918KCX2_9ACTN|nr:hypothetical protein GCM10010358_11490 [Streptomyces minutiscleroticus]